MRVRTPLPLTLWSSSCTRVRFYEGLRDDYPFLYARWRAAHTLYAQYKAAKLLDAVNGHERLFYVPPALARGMRQIGFTALTSSAKWHVYAGRELAQPWLAVQPRTGSRGRYKKAGTRFRGSIEERTSVRLWKCSQALTRALEAALFVDA